MSGWVESQKSKISIPRTSEKSRGEIKDHIPIFRNNQSQFASVQHLSAYASAEVIADCLFCEFG